MDAFRIFTNELASGVAAKYGLKPVAQRARFWDHSGYWKHYDGQLFWLVIAPPVHVGKRCHQDDPHDYGQYAELPGSTEPFCCANCVELLPEFLYSQNGIEGLALNEQA